MAEEEEEVEEDFDPEKTDVWGLLKKALSHGIVFAGGLLIGNTAQVKGSPAIPEGHRRILADIEVEIGTLKRNFKDLAAPYIKIFQHKRLEDFGTQGATENVLVGMDDMETQFDNCTDILIQITNNPALKEEGYQGWDMDIVCMGGYAKNIYFRGLRILAYPSEGHYHFQWVIPPP